MNESDKSVMQQALDVEQMAFNKWRNNFVNVHGHMPTEADAWKSRAAIAQPVEREQTSLHGYKGPARFTPEETLNGGCAIRWVTTEAVCGRPTFHDVLDYIAQMGEEIDCTCERCQSFIFGNTVNPNVQPVEPHDLQKRLEALHQYEDIAEHYAKCAISPEGLRDWVAEMMDMPTIAQPVHESIASDAIECVAQAVTKTDIDHVFETLYDHGNGKYRGAVSKAQRDKAIAICEALEHCLAQPDREHNFCPRCGKRLGGIDDVHTCTAPAHLNLRSLVHKVHAAKGRHHSQIAMCDLYDACGLTNVRPGVETKETK